MINATFCTYWDLENATWLRTLGEVISIPGVSFRHKIEVYFQLVHFHDVQCKFWPHEQLCLVDDNFLIRSTDVTNIIFAISFEG